MPALQLIRLLAPVLLFASVATAAENTARSPGQSDDNTVPLELSWEQLMPEGELERLAALYDDFYATLGGTANVAEGSAADTMQQIGTFRTVDTFDGKRVRLPGYVVPLDFAAGAHSEFLLVPYFGACLHTPPPPPNQIVYVRADPAVSHANIYDPVWIEGILRSNRRDTDLGNAAYLVELSKLERYDY